MHMYVLLVYNVSAKEVEWLRMERNGCHEHFVGTNLERDVIYKLTKYNHLSERLRKFTKNIRNTYRPAEI